MESRFQKTAKNVVFATINQCVTLVLSIVNRTFFIWFLGVEYLGISGLFADILTMLSLADLGIGTAMVYSYYKPLSEENHVKIAQLTQFYRKVYTIIAVVATAIGISMIPFLRYLINLDTPVEHIYLYYTLMVANTVVSYLFVYKTSILNADQKNYIISKYQTIINCIRMGVQIIILICTRNYALYLVIQVLATAINNILTSRKADKLYPYITQEVPKIDKNERTSVFANIKSMALYKICLVVFSGIDNTLISVLVGTIWIGYYSNYNLIISTINTFINILYSSATASIGNIIASENEEKRYNVFKLIQVFSLVITTITTACLFALTTDLLKVWLGEGYLLTNDVFIVILLNFYFNGLVHPIWSFREACGLYNRTKYIMLIAAIINFLLSVLFGLKFGISGILIASLIARIVTYFWYEPKILFGEYFKKSEKNYYIPILKNVLVTLLICGLVFELGKIIVVNNIIMLFVKAILICVFVSVITLLCYWNDSALKNLLFGYIKKLLRRRVER